MNFEQDCADRNHEHGEIDKKLHSSARDEEMLPKNNAGLGAAVPRHDSHQAWNQSRRFAVLYLVQSLRGPLVGR